jgi:hypothetical protein
MPNTIVKNCVPFSRPHFTASHRTELGVFKSGIVSENELARQFEYELTAIFGVANWASVHGAKFLSTVIS